VSTDVDGDDRPTASTENSTSLFYRALAGGDFSDVFALLIALYKLDVNALAAADRWLTTTQVAELATLTSCS
jgi:hypothetical protein